jgi:ABC-type nitrate/sulfonate/bicarbonate transport system permease component
MIAGVAGISASYFYLRARFMQESEDQPILRSYVWSCIIKYSVFVCVLAQPWIAPYTWLLYAPMQSLAPSVVFAAFFLFICLSFVVWRTLGVDFEQASIIQKHIIIAEITRKRRNSIVSVILFMALLAVWHFSSLAGWQRLLISPQAVFSNIYFYFILGHKIPYWEHPIWFDIGLSSAKVFAGIALSVSVAWLALHWLSSYRAAANRVLSFFQYANFSAVILSLSMIYAFNPPDLLIAIAIIATATFQPVLETLWAARNCPTACRLILSGRSGIPFAVTSLLFAETISSTTGLGLFILFSNESGRIGEAMAAVHVWFFLLVVCRAILDWAARLYASPQLEDDVS